MGDTPTWADVAAQVRAALKYWDAYCMDDGRPIAALDAACCYYADPSLENRNRLGQRTPMAQAAGHMAWEANAPRPAWAAVAAVYYLCNALYDWPATVRTRGLTVAAYFMDHLEADGEYTGFSWRLHTML